MPFNNSGFGQEAFNKRARATEIPAGPRLPRRIPPGLGAPAGPNPDLETPTQRRKRKVRAAKKRASKKYGGTRTTGGASGNL